MIVLACVIVVLIVVSLICYYCLRKNRNGHKNMSVADESSFADKAGTDVAYGYQQ